MNYDSVSVRISSNEVSSGGYEVCGMVIDDQIHGQEGAATSNPPSEVSLTKKSSNVVNVLAEAFAIFRIA
jgi:hypothetical protein